MHSGADTFTSRPETCMLGSNVHVGVNASVSG